VKKSGKKKISPAEAVRLSDSQLASKPEGFAKSLKGKLDGRTILPKEDLENSDNRSAVVEFLNSEGDKVGDGFEVPLNLDRDGLKELLSDVGGDEYKEGDYSFYVELLKETNESGSSPKFEISEQLGKAIDEAGHSTESIISIFVIPRDEVNVRPVSRCSNSMTGHAESILVCAFSPNGKIFATAGGDCCVRLWDVEMGMPYKTLKRHKSWVQAMAFSPCGKYLATGGMDGIVVVWRPEQKIDKSAKAHDGIILKKGKLKWGKITSLCWQPLHLMEGVSSTSLWRPGKLAVGDDKGQFLIFDVGDKGLVYGGHKIHQDGAKKTVTDIAWAGNNTLFSSGRDGTVVVFDVPKNCVKDIQRRHKHWVNSLALNSAHVIRSGPFTPKEMSIPVTLEDAIARTKTNYDKFISQIGTEVLASASDDYFIYLYTNLNNLKEVSRLSGHIQVINHIQFSPNGKLLASGSFDKSVRLWNGVTGRYLARFRNHVGRVYRLSWAPDSRWLVSASQDSTLKLWDCRDNKREMHSDLPGAADEIYCLEWSTDGKFVGSGGRDRVVRLWRH